ncbi:MAG: cbb3-type cytochrome c oxidase N-terminal domain-containing protein [Kofleriaceae bacterium]
MTTAQIARSAGELADEPHEDARLLTHAYDGIREYDNPLPSWWSWIFIGTIVFAGFYGLYFEVVGWGRSPSEAYREALAKYDSKREDRERAEAVNVTEQGLAAGVNDGKLLARGSEVFATRCASCHGPKGAGLIGPNLTDDRELHGATRLDIFKTVRGGVPGTAMLAWGEQLAPQDILAAATFAISIRNTMVPGKQPEGLPVGPFVP